MLPVEKNKHLTKGGKLAACGPYVDCHIVFSGPRKHSGKYFNL